MITKEAENSVFRFIIYLLFIMQRELMLQTPSSSPAVYLYFSARARATAARNLSIDTWTSGVKSSGNMMAMTTRMLWERICENKYQTHVTWMWILTPNPLLCVVRSGSTTLHVESTLRSGYLKEIVFIQSSYNNKQTPQSQVLRMIYRFKLFTLKLAGSTLRVKACSSLRFARPAFRSSSWDTANSTPFMTVFPCFNTWAEPGLRSFQWEK